MEVPVVHIEHDGYRSKINCIFIRTRAGERVAKTKIRLVYRKDRFRVKIKISK